jgi:hypothetical protein
MKTLEIQTYCLRNASYGDYGIRCVDAVVFSVTKINDFLYFICLEAG